PHSRRSAPLDPARPRSAPLTSRSLPLGPARPLAFLRIRNSPNTWEGRRRDGPGAPLNGLLARTVRAAANPVHGQRGLDGGVSGQTVDPRRCDRRGSRLFGTKLTPDGRRRGHPGASVSHYSPPTTSVLADPHTS